MSKEHEAPKFAVLAVDTAIFALRNGELVVRLIRVDRPPFFVDAQGLPGGLVEPTESAEDAARRLVREKASIDHSKLHFEQLYTFSDVDRDPRGRVVAVVYSGYVVWEDLSVAEQADTADAWWAKAGSVRGLAYDHDAVLRMARERLASRARYTTLISALMPKEFTLTELESSYECILGEELDKRNFRKKIEKLGVLKETPRMRSGGRFRPARLYRFSTKAVREVPML